MKFGLELEWADIDITKKLPEGFYYSNTEKTIVNSNGHANHPLGLYRFGGEINTPVADSPEELIHKIEPILEVFPERSVNYRESLHIHVSFPELMNLEFLKSSLIIFDRTIKNLILSVYPLPGMFESNEYECNIQQLRTRWMKPWKRDLCLNSTSVDDFCECMRKDKTGKVSFMIPNRYAVNFFSIKKHGTLEFRLIPATISPVEIFHSMKFVEEICNMLIENREPDYRDICSRFPLPKPLSFSSDLEAGWVKTQADNKEYWGKK